ncbi:MAG: PKD domain-containing protein [Cytophagales bacterium]
MRFFRYIFLLFGITLSLHAQTYSLTSSSKLNSSADSLIVSFLLTADAVNSLTPTVSVIDYTFKLDTNYFDLKNSAIVNKGRYDANNPIYGAYFNAVKLIKYKDTLTYEISKKLSTSTNSISILSSTVDTLGKVAIPIKRCFESWKITFQKKSSIPTRFLNALGQNVVLSSDIVDYTFVFSNVEVLKLANKYVPNLTAVSTTDTICKGNTAKINVSFNPNKDTAYYAKNWNNGTIGNASPYLLVNTAGIYTYKIVDPKFANCSRSVTKTIKSYYKLRACFRVLQTTKNKVLLANKDTVLVCTSDLKKMRLSDSCRGFNVAGVWKYRKPKYDSTILSVVNNSITVNTAGLYIYEVKDSIAGKCSIVIRDSVWILTRKKAFITTSPNLKTLRVCLDQSLQIKVNSTIPLIGTNYTFTSSSHPVLYNYTPPTNKTGEFSFKFNRSYFDKNTESIVQVKSNISLVDTFGCSYDTSSTLLVLNLKMHKINDTTLCTGDTVRISTYNETNLFSYFKDFKYTWKPTSILSNVVQPYDLTGKGYATFKPLQDSKITVIQEFNNNINTSGCKDSTSFNVTIKQGALLEVTKDTSFCDNNIGTVNLLAKVLNPQNGVTYSYKWYNTSTLSDSTSGATKSVKPNSTTIYKAVVKPSSGCIAYKSTKIGIGSSPNVTLLSPKSDTTVCPSYNVLLKNAVSNGTKFTKAPYYKFEWKDSATNNLISSLPSYNYSAIKKATIQLTVTDSIGCKDQKSVKIKVSEFKLNNPLKDTALCFGGKITPKSVDATGSSTYTYKWNASTTISNVNIESPTITPTDTTKASLYVLNVTDNFGCKLADSMTVLTNTKPKFSLTGTQSQYCFGNNYPIGIKIIKGLKPLNIEWKELSNNTGLDISNKTINNTLTPATVGTGQSFQVTVIDSVGCSNFTKWTFETKKSPDVHLGNDTSICAGNSIIPKTYVNGTEVYTYSYTFNNSSATANTILKTSGLYIVKASNNIGCSTTDSLNLLVKDTLGNLSINSNTNFCKGEKITLESNLTKGNGDISYSWTSDGANGFFPNAIHTSKFTKDTVFYNTTNSDNSILVVNVMATNGCNKVIATKNINLFNTPEVHITSATPNPVFVNLPVVIAQNSTNADVLNWNLGDGTTFTSSSSEYTHTYSDVKNYQVILTSTNAIGCSDADTLEIKVINVQNIYIPNVMSISSLNPENKIVKVYGSNISEKNFSYSVYDKWGQKIFETNSLNIATTDGWNGQINNSGSSVPLGTYSYIVKGEFSDNTLINKVGTITVIK